MNEKQKLLITFMNMESQIDNIYNEITDSEIDDLFHYLLSKLDECKNIVSNMK